MFKYDIAAEGSYYSKRVFRGLSDIIYSIPIFSPACLLTDHFMRLQLRTIVASSLSMYPQRQHVNNDLLLPLLELATVKPRVETSVDREARRTSALILRKICILGPVNNPYQLRVAKH